MTHPVTMAGMGTTQFINQKLLEETPIFSKKRVDFTPQHPITHLVAANGCVVMAMANRVLIRCVTRTVTNYCMMFRGDHYTS